MTTQQETDERRRLERAREIALFRYSLIQEVISPQLTAAQRGRRVRELAAMPHPGPDGTEVRVSYQSDQPVEAGLPGRRVRGAGPGAAAGQPADPGRGAGAGGGAEAGEPGADRRAGAADLAGQSAAGRRRTGRCSGCSSGWS